MRQTVEQLQRIYRCRVKLYQDLIVLGRGFFYVRELQHIRWSVSCVCTIAFKRSAHQECFRRRHDSGPIESWADTTPRYPSSPACARRSPELTYGPFFGEPQRIGTKFKRGNGKLTCRLMATTSTLGMPLWEFHFIFWVASRSTRTSLIGVLRHLNRSHYPTACETYT